MEISFRLKKIAEKVKNSSVIADIGTDHAYIPIFLYKNNKIKKAIACDISRGSLQKAKENVLKYRLGDNIDIRFGDGLSPIFLEDNIDTIIISGIGGILMIDILSGGKYIVNNIDTLILQPQKDIDKVRKYLHEQNFSIIDDDLFIDEDKFYTIIVAKKGKEKIKYTKEEYIFGRFQIENKSNILKKYILNQLYKIERVLINLKDASSNERTLQMENQYKLYKEVLEWL